MQTHSLTNLWTLVTAQFPLGPHSDHGPAHWKRVERNGLYLASVTGARKDVIQLFALFHDSRRQNEFTDPDHGRRGAALARQWRGLHFEIDDTGFDLLVQACNIHTEALHCSDPTIATCLDADRLDLSRVGITPDARFMSTEPARKLAQSGDFTPLKNFK